MAKTTESIEHHGAHHDAHEPNYMDPNVSMTILVWVTFFILLAILKKFAWKPILDGLKTREEKIEKSLEDAERIKDEMSKLEEKTRSIIEQANTESKLIVDEARKAAADASKAIENKAREEAKIILENARRDITEEKEKVQAELKETSARLAIELAGKVIEENLDSEKNRKLVNQYIKDI